MHDRNSSAPSANTNEFLAPSRKTDEFAEEHEPLAPDARDEWLARRAAEINRRIKAVANRESPAASLPVTTEYSQTRSNVKQLYALIDNITNTLMGGVQVHLNNASAIRTVYDIATADTLVNKHPLDFDLYLLGSLGDDHRLHNNLTKILSGAQIAEMVNAQRAAREKQ